MSSKLCFVRMCLELVVAIVIGTSPVLSAERWPPISERSLSELMVVVEYDRERGQLRSGELLDFRRETDRHAYWKRTTRNPEWDKSHRFLIPRGSVHHSKDRSLLVLHDIFGYGGIGSYLSIWRASGDSLLHECVCPEILGGGFDGLTEILTVAEASKAMYVLIESKGADGGDAWGGLQVRLVQDCRASLYFQEGWEADNICMSGTPLVDYQYIPEASTDSLIVVNAKSQVCKADASGKSVYVAQPDKEIRIRLGDPAQTR